MVAPLLNRSVGDLLYDYSLSAAYRSAWVYDPDLALSKEPDVWEIIRRDAAFYSSIDRGIKAIVRPYRVEAPPSSKDKKGKLFASVVQHGLSRIEGFGAARRRLACAVALGRAYEYVNGEEQYVDLAGTGPMKWWMPTRLENIDRRRFHWVPDRTPRADGTTKISTHLEFYNYESNRWEKTSPEFEQALIEYIHWNSEDRLGYGRGLLESTFFYHYCKTTTFEKVAQGIDRWANGILIASMDALRHASSGKSNSVLQASALSMLKTMRSEHVAVVENIDQIEVKETSGTGHEMSTGWITYLDQTVERLWNGSVRPSGSALDNNSGARAQASVESDNSEAFHQPNREDLDEALQKIVRLFVSLNWQNLDKLGLLGGELPKITSEQVKMHDPVQALQVAQGLQQMGFPIITAELAHKTGFSVPDEDDEVLEMPLDPLAGGSAPGGGGGDGGGDDASGQDVGKAPKIGAGSANRTANRRNEMDKFRRVPGGPGGGRFAPK